MKLLTQRNSRLNSRLRSFSQHATHGHQCGLAHAGPTHRPCALAPAPPRASPSRTAQRTHSPTTLPARATQRAAAARASSGDGEAVHLLREARAEALALGDELLVQPPRALRAQLRDMHVEPRRTLRARGLRARARRCRASGHQARGRPCKGRNGARGVAG